MHRSALITPNITRWTFAATLFMLGVGVIRLIMLADRDSEELSWVTHTLADEIVGGVYPIRTPAQRTPQQELEFWIPAIRQVLAEHPGDAELHAAAATVLDRPSMMYVSDLTGELLENEDGDAVKSSWQARGRLQERMQKDQRDFEAISFTEVLANAKRATELSPTDPRWWRLRALFTWQDQVFLESEPRIDDWKSVLEQARTHDPGNALYPILEARAYLDHALEYDQDQEYKVGYLDAWHRLVDLAKEASEARFFALGDPAMPGVARSYRLAGHPRHTTRQAMLARSTAARSTSKIALLLRELLRMADVQHFPKGSPSKRALLGFNQAIYSLVVSAKHPGLRYDGLLAYLDKMTAQQQFELELHQTVEQTGVMSVSDSTRDRLDQAKEWVSDLKAGNENPSLIRGPSPATAVSWINLLALDLLAPLLWLSAGSGILWVITTRNPASLRMAPWPVAMLVTSLIGTLFVLGFAPTDRVSDRLQHWIFTALVFAILVCITALVYRRVGFRWRFGIRTCCIASFVFALVFHAIIEFGIGWSSVGLPIQFDAEQHPMLSYVKGAGGSASGLYTGDSDYALVSLNWVLLHGGFCTVACFGAAASLALMWKSSIRVWVSELATTTTWLSMFVATCWVWGLPSELRAGRPATDRIDNYLLDPHPYYQPLEDWLERRKEE